MQGSAFIQEPRLIQDKEGLCSVLGAIEEKSGQLPREEIHHLHRLGQVVRRFQRSKGSPGKEIFQNNNGWGGCRISINSKARIGSKKEKTPHRAVATAWQINKIHKYWWAVGRLIE